MFHPWPKTFFGVGFSSIRWLPNFLQKNVFATFEIIKSRRCKGLRFPVLANILQMSAFFQALFTVFSRFIRPLFGPPTSRLQPAFHSCTCSPVLLLTCSQRTPPGRHVGWVLAPTRFLSSHVASRCSATEKHMYDGVGKTEEEVHHESAKVRKHERRRISATPFRTFFSWFRRIVISWSRPLRPHKKLFVAQPLNSLAVAISCPAFVRPLSAPCPPTPCWFHPPCILTLIPECIRQPAARHARTARQFCFQGTPPRKARHSVRCRVDEFQRKSLAPHRGNTAPTAAVILAEARPLFKIQNWPPTIFDALRIMAQIFT